MSTEKGCGCLKQTSSFAKQLLIISKQTLNKEAQENHRKRLTLFQSYSSKLHIWYKS